jgi:predicted dehydrogenase
MGLITKVWSRIREDRRNDKYVSCGIGKIIESAGDESLPKGKMVAFVATMHPALVERIVLPKEFIFSINDSFELPEISENNILYLPLGNGKLKDIWWKEFIGWSVYSGTEVSEEGQKQILEGLKKEIRDSDWKNSQKISTQKSNPISEIKGDILKPSSNKKSAVLFGYGNYAKINIIPYTSPFVDIKSVHEIDPTQIFVERRVQRWDSAPFPRENEKYDVYFVASYNHTHVPITLHALNQGAYVVVEKPVVMDYGDLDNLEKALKIAGRKLFIGFHKRYGTFNDLALKDLGVKYGEPISYHSIVYELIQPEFFWYNWPVSRSTFFANGCHQIDHFLHLNNFSKPINFDIKLLQDHAVEVWIELENGAVFTTTFSEKGSMRVGPRDIVELKVPGKNIRIIDATRYLSEDDHKIIRKKRIFKTNSYRDMYREIGRRIANNEPGDSIESVMISGKIMLDLEEKLQNLKGWGDRYEKAKNRFWGYFR